MPISTSSFGDQRDGRYGEYEENSNFEFEAAEYAGLTVEMAETLLKRLGGGVAEKHKQVEGIGWKAIFTSTAEGTEVAFHAHDELLDDLIRRFDEMVEKAVK